jgi:hypothetical protein
MITTLVETSGQVAFIYSTLQGEGKLVFVIQLSAITTITTEHHTKKIASHGK